MTQAPHILQQIDEAIASLQVEVDEAINDLQHRIQSRQDIKHVENRINQIDAGITNARQLIEKLSAANN